MQIRTNIPFLISRNKHIKTTCQLLCGHWLTKIQIQKYKVQILISQNEHMGQFLQDGGKKQNLAFF